MAYLNESPKLTPDVALAYDQAGRLVLIDRAAAFQSRYRYDAAGRLRELQHRRGKQVLGHFAYEVDALGNRVSATEALPQPGRGTTTLTNDDPAVDYYRGTWSASGDLRVSQDVSAGLRLVFFGRSATLTLGVGPDYGICDVYVNGLLWQGFDNCAASAGEDAILLTLQGDGPHVLEVLNRAEKSRSSTGCCCSRRRLRPARISAVRQGENRAGDWGNKNRASGRRREVGGRSAYAR